MNVIFHYCSGEDGVYFVLFQHTCALESGFRNSGITIGKHGKIILAVRSCIGLEVPLTEDGIMLVSNEVGI
jgi:tRNA(Phe) wybutosine-synthesizing methylase Tyw3